MKTYEVFFYGKKIDEINAEDEDSAIDEAFDRMGIKIGRSVYYALNDGTEKLIYEDVDDDERIDFHDFVQENIRVIEKVGQSQN